MIVASLLLLALTRAEIVDRFRATPVVQLNGLVQVVANCPTDMRREYQLPIAGYASDVCRSLYAGDRLKPRLFDPPGIVIHIGDLRTNVTHVVARTATRADGTKYTKIFLPAPGYSDRRALAFAVARAYFLAVHGTVIDDKAARHALMSSSPELRTAETCERLADWAQRGVYADGLTDEDYLKLSRKILYPGHLTEHELEQFTSRLHFNPLTHDAPFAGRYAAIDFKSAIRLCQTDLSLRYLAFVKAQQLRIFGGGRGEELQAASLAYVAFLTELSRGEKTEDELRELLADADRKLEQCHSKCYNSAYGQASSPRSP